MSGQACPAPGTFKVVGAGHDFATVATIATPLLIVFFVSIFVWFKSSSIFLRKRSTGLILVDVVGIMLLWSVTALFDVLGADVYPCWLMGLLVYACVPISATSILLRAFKYVNEVSASRLLKGQTSLSIADISLFDGLRGHIKVMLGRGNERDRLQHARFISSPAFNFTWLAMAILPCMIAYVIRLAGTNWRNGCFGCDLETADAAFLASFYLFGTVFYTCSMPSRISTTDALHIKRESVISWFYYGTSITLGMLLYLIDPGQAYKNSLFNFRIVCLFGPIISLYVQTVHQVVKARMLQRKLLISPHFDREDAFEDVIQDKDLLQKLRNFLHQELSGEILAFIDAVDAFRSEFESKKEGRNARARYIYDEYIVRRAPSEVNLSSKVRKDIINAIETAHIDATVFNDAYTEVKSSLLKDGFTRFLMSLRREASSGGSRLVNSSSAVVSSVV